MWFYVFRLIELGMEGKVIKTQDLAALLHVIARNPKGQKLAWNFVKENWIHLLKKLVFTYIQCLFLYPVVSIA